MLLHCLGILVFDVMVLSQIHHVLSPALADPHFPWESVAVEQALNPQDGCISVCSQELLRVHSF